MPKRYDLLLKNGVLVDPVNRKTAVTDVAVQGGKIVEIAPELDPSFAKDSLDMKGNYILPGIIDLHVHASAWLGGQFAHTMMAHAGVTTALDMSGPIDSVLKIASNKGVGLNLACIEYVRPSHTVENSNPSKQDLKKLLDSAMKQGALGLKLLGGHYPLSPEATSNTIELTAKNGAYCAFHAGTTATLSDLTGALEAIELVGGNRVHLAHINSYCRGKVKDSAAETEEVIEALINSPNICSESYLSPLNGTSARCSQGIPESEVTKMCLETGGYPQTEQGLEDSIREGWGQINLESGGEVILAIGEKGLNWWRHCGTDTTISFKVNPEIPRVRLATAKREDGEFVVDCISTDGGGIPRNVTASMGLALVKLQMLTIEEFVIKTSRNPATILGLPHKGHLALGMDADITAVNPEKQKAVMTMVGGKPIMWQGMIWGSGTQFITTVQGEKYIKQQGLSVITVDPNRDGFCTRKRN